MSDIKWIPLSGMELSAANLAAAEKLRKFGFAVNCGEFGSEKLTKTGLCIYDVLQEKDNPSILLVTSDRLLYGWYRILLTGLGVDFKIITGAPNALAFFNEDCPNLYLMSRDALMGQNVLRTKAGTQFVWDLIIIDEEQNTGVPDYAAYQQNIPWKSEKFLVIAQFPQKTQEDAQALSSLIKSVMDDSSLAAQADEMLFSVNTSLFDADSPVMRYYSAQAMSSDARNVQFCEYSFDESVIKSLRRRADLRTGVPAYRYGGNVFEDYDYEPLRRLYEKNSFTRSDVEDLRAFDKKLDAFINLADEIENDNDSRAMVYVCEKATADYLKKVLAALYGAGSVYAARGEIFRSEDIIRKLRVDDSVDYPKFIIGIDTLGAVGEGFDRINVIVNYELPASATMLERRMTRHGSAGEAQRRFVLFRDTNKLFDSRMLNKVLFNTLADAFCAELPTRNILLDIPQKGEILYNAAADLAYAIGYASEVDNCIDYIKRFKADYILLGAEKINTAKQLVEFAQELMDKLCAAFGIEKDVTREQADTAANALGGLCYIENGRITALTENETSRLAKSFEGDGWRSLPFASEAVKGLSSAKDRIDELHKNAGYHLHIKQELSALADCIQYPVLYGIWRYRVREKDSARSFKDFIKIYNDGI